MMPQFRFTIRKLLFVIALIAILLAAWHQIKRDSLRDWNEPASKGKIAVAFLVEWESGEVLESAVKSITPMMEPSNNVGDGILYWYTPEIRAGYARVEREADNYDDLQQLSDDVHTTVTAQLEAEGISSSLRIYVVDEHGTIYTPTDQ